MTFRFLRFDINRDTRQLLADGSEVPLTPKAFALLLMLVEDRDRALSKAELQERLWPATFIGETNLTTLIAELRRALGDSPQNPSCIRTVHRFGYQFVARVAQLSPATSAAPAGARMFLRTADRQFSLMEGATTIGRGGDTAVQIDSGGVSRHHARIVIASGNAWIEDLGSKNGTFLGGTPIVKPQQLTDGDEIRVGPVVLIFTVAPMTQPTETMK